MISNKLPVMKKNPTPIRNIKFYCKNWCSSGEIKQWKECPTKECPLWIYRLGKRGTGTNKKSDMSNIIKKDNSNQKTTPSYQFLTPDKQLEMIQ